MATTTTTTVPCACCDTGVSSTCCAPTPLPRTLYVTFTGGLSASFAIVYDASPTNYPGEWYGEVTFAGCSAPSAFITSCSGGSYFAGFNLVRIGGSAGSCGIASFIGYYVFTCEPLYMSRVYDSSQIPLEGCCAGTTFTVTVTP